jgi:tetratricopeptide (TPR) repeat protein
MPHPTARTVAAACGLLALAVADTAFAQYPILVHGGGYARQCYEAVKDKVYPLKAIETCDIAIGQEDLSRSNLAATLVNRGIVFMRQQNYDRAMKDYDRALGLLPGMPEAKINLGAMLYHLERFEEAVVALDDGVTAKNLEARAAAYYNRAIAHERLGDIQRAYDDYRAAIAAVPGYAPAVRQLQRYSILPASG